MQTDFDYVILLPARYGYRLVPEKIQRDPSPHRPNGIIRIIMSFRYVNFVFGTNRTFHCGLLSCETSRKTVTQGQYETFLYAD